jgi:rare lipoprotein A
MIRAKERTKMPNFIYKHTLTVSALCLFLVLGGCTSSPKGRYSIAQDTAPSFDYGSITYTEVIPQPEPYNKWTARPYNVLGKKYYPIQTGEGFEERGSASWYGEKFHGHKTANGEIFDMFALTAAHKTLPLPSFVRVSNIANGKSAIVRVNDRGPFHGKRIIDLSYGAAKKLGYHKHGVADVKLEVLHVSDNGDIRIGDNKQLYVYKKGELIAKQAPIPEPTATTLLAQNNTTDFSSMGSPPGYFVQVMAMENGDKAKVLATGLSNLLQVPNAIPKIANIYKLQLGPLANEQKARNVIQELKKIGFEQAFTVVVSP